MRTRVSVEKTTSSKPPTRIRPDRPTRIHQTNVSTIPSCRLGVHCTLRPNQYQGLMDWCALRAHAARDRFGWLVEESKNCPRNSMSSVSVVASPEKRLLLAFRT